jgi:hypothetical protein
MTRTQILIHGNAITADCIARIGEIVVLEGYTSVMKFCSYHQCVFEKQECRYSDQGHKRESIFRIKKDAMEILQSF